MHDVIIVGARCAGASTALLLARRGFRVLLVDKAIFPSDTMSGHYIHQAGVARLQRWGLRDRLAATGCPPVTRTTFDLGDFALTGAPPAAEGGVAEGYAPRRYVIDTLLAQAAEQAGAEVRDGFAVDDLIWDWQGNVTGIRGHAKGGPTVTERAYLVIGADGMNSLVARGVGAPEYNTVPSRTCGYYTYWSGVPVSGVELYPRDGRFVVAVPTHDGLTNIAVIWPHSEFHRVRTDIEPNYLESLSLAPGLAERVHAGRRVERFVGTGVTPGFFRKPYGPGWALVGDAGYHRDPITAQGMTDAFRDAELVADAVTAALEDRQPMAEALAGYEAARNAAVAPMYDMTCQLAELAPPPAPMRQLFAALRGNQPQIDRFLGTMAGTVPIPDFFAPDNVQKIVSAAARKEQTA